MRFDPRYLPLQKLLETRGFTVRKNATFRGEMWPIMVEFKSASATVGVYLRGTFTSDNKNIEVNRFFPDGITMKAPIEWMMAATFPYEMVRGLGLSVEGIKRLEDKMVPKMVKAATRGITVRRLIREEHSNG